MAGPFRSVAWFRVKPDCHAAFESAFEATGMLTRPLAIDGFLHAELFRSLTAADEYWVLGEWATEASYAAWQAAAVTGADRVAMRALAETLAEHRPGQLLTTTD